MRRSASGSDELCLDVRLWPHSVAIADLMRLPLCAKSRHRSERETGAATETNGPMGEGYAAVASTAGLFARTARSASAWADHLSGVFQPCLCLD